MKFSSIHANTKLLLIILATVIVAGVGVLIYTKTVNPSASADTIGQGFGIYGYAYIQDSKLVSQTLEGGVSLYMHNLADGTSSKDVIFATCNGTDTGVRMWCQALAKKNINPFGYYRFAITKQGNFQIGTSTPFRDPMSGSLYEVKPQLVTITPERLANGTIFLPLHLTLQDNQTE